jgi:hypothetical protein
MHSMRIVLPDGREQSRTSRRDWSVPPGSLENDRAVFEVNEGQTVDHVRVGGEDDGVIALMGGSGVISQWKRCSIRFPRRQLLETRSAYRRQMCERSLTQPSLIPAPIINNENWLSAFAPSQVYSEPSKRRMRA